MVALLALCAIAYASRLDPRLIAGFWDDGDRDNVVILVISIASAADMNLVVALVSVLVVVSVATLEQESFSARTRLLLALQPSTRKILHSALQ
jgi:hypothetical protein